MPLIPSPTRQFANSSFTMELFNNLQAINHNEVSSTTTTTIADPNMVILIDSPKNFHAMATVLEFVSGLPKEKKANLKHSIISTFDEMSQMICAGVTKRLSSREMFELFTYSAEKNAGRLRRELLTRLHDSEISNIKLDDLNDKLMMSWLDAWYPYASARSCFWNGSNGSIKNIFNNSNIKMSSHICRLCATYFIKANKHGSAPEMFRRMKAKLQKIFAAQMPPSKKASAEEGQMQDENEEDDEEENEVSTILDDIINAKNSTSTESTDTMVTVPSTASGGEEGERQVYNHIKQSIEERGKKDSSRDEDRRGEHSSQHRSQHRSSTHKRRRTEKEGGDASKRPKN